jgi:hypothetical protein
VMGGLTLGCGQLCARLPRRVTTPDNMRHTVRPKYACDLTIVVFEASTSGARHSVQRCLHNSWDKQTSCPTKMVEFQEIL